MISDIAYIISMRECHSECRCVVALASRLLQPSIIITLWDTGVMVFVVTDIVPCANPCSPSLKSFLYTKHDWFHTCVGNESLMKRKSSKYLIVLK